MIDLTKKEQPAKGSLPEAYKNLLENFRQFAKQLYEGVRCVVDRLWDLIRRCIGRAYRFILERRIAYYEDALRVTKKTVARRQLIKKQVSIRQMLTSIEGGARYG